MEKVKQNPNLLERQSGRLNWQLAITTVVIAVGVVVFESAKLLLADEAGGWELSIWTAVFCLTYVPAGILLVAHGYPRLKCYWDKKYLENTSRSGKFPQALTYEESLKKTILASDEAILLLDGDRCLICNDAAVQTFCKDSQKELLRSPWSFSQKNNNDYLSPKQETREIMEQAYSKGAHYFEWKCFNWQGRGFVLAVSLTPINWHGKRVIHAAFRDISESIRLEASILNAKKELEQALDSVSDMIAIVDTQGIIIRANKTMANAIGIRVQALIGRPCKGIVHGTECSPEFCPMRKVLRTAMPNDCEFHDDNSGLDLWVTASPIFDSEGNIQSVVHIIRDITAREQARAKLERTVSEMERFNSIAVGREMRMIELKKEINQLAENSDSKRPYELDFLNSNNGAD